MWHGVCVPVTFDVGVLEALQAAGAETGLVVPCAIDLLCVLVLTVTDLCVAVVEVTVDRWEEGTRQAIVRPEPGMGGSGSIGRGGSPLEGSWQSMAAGPEQPCRGIT
jgi:hypothetical protein